MLTTPIANKTNSLDDIQIAHVYLSNANPSDISLWSDLPWPFVRDKIALILPQS